MMESEKFKTRVGKLARRADGLVSFQKLAGSRPRKSWYFPSSPTAGKNGCASSISQVGGVSSHSEENQPFRAFQAFDRLDETHLQ